MAFNPFHRFRKHQKTLIAGLAIFCMIMFVGSLGFGGGGDPFSALIRAFGGRGSSPKVASLYGKDVTQRDLTELEQQRTLAHEFLRRSIDKAGQKILEDEKKRPEHAGMDPQAMNMSLQNNTEFKQIGTRYFRLYPASRGANELLDFMIWQKQADNLNIHLTNDDIQKLLYRLTNKRVSPADANAILTDIAKTGARYSQGATFKNLNSDTLFKALGEEFRVKIAQMALEGYSTGGRRSLMQEPELAEVPALPTPDQFWDYYRNQCSTLDVALVPFKAEDFLGKVTDKPTEKDLQDLYEKGKNSDYNPLSSEPGFKRPRQIQVQWVSGKADEASYKDTAARNETLIQAAFATASGAALNDFGGVTLLALNLDRGETNLKARYADEKEQWRYYRRLLPAVLWDFASKSHLQTEVLNQREAVDHLILQTVGTALMGLPAPVVAATAQTAVVGPATLRVNDMKIAELFLRAGASGSPIAAAATAYYSQVSDEFLPYAQARAELQKEENERLSREVLAGNLEILKNVLEMKQTPTQLAEAISLAGASGPFAAAARLTADAKDPDFEKGLSELRDQLVAKLIKDYGLKTGKTTGFRSQLLNKIADDPGLKPLKDAYLKPPAEDSTGEKFGDLFFESMGRKPYTVDFWPRDRFPVGADKATWRTADEPFLFWTTEDQKAETLPLEPEPKPLVTAAGTIGKAASGPLAAVVSFSGGSSEPEIRRRVEKAWRLLKARELAKKAAEDAVKNQIAEIVAKWDKVSGSDETKKKDLEAALAALAGKDSAGKDKLIVLDGQSALAHQKFDKVPFGHAEYRHKGPEIDKTKVPNLAAEISAANFAQLPPQYIEQYINLLHPTATPAQKMKLIRGISLGYGDAFAEELLKLQDKKKGDAVVVSDNPQETYYAAVLLNQSAPSMKEFYTVYRNPASAPMIPGMPEQQKEPFFNNFVQEMQFKYRTELMERLRKDAKLELNKENLGRMGGSDDF